MGRTCLTKLIIKNRISSNNCGFEIIPQSEFEEMTNQRTTFIVRHGWVIDSIKINGIMVGTSQGGNMSSFELEPTETILSVSADRVKFEGRVCLTKLKFTTSTARVLGPFGNPPGNLRPVDSIAFDINGIDDIKFVPTRDGKLVHNIRKKAGTVSATNIEVRSGWIVDSIAINGTNGSKVGESTGGSFNQLTLMPGEQVVQTRADRVRYQGMICLARLYFKTSLGREFGPFGSAPAGNCPITGNINLSVNSIRDLKFIPTRNSKYLHDIKVRNNHM